MRCLPRNMNARIPMSAPDLDGSDESAVLEALRSGVLGLGPMAEEFERRAAELRRRRPRGRGQLGHGRDCT